MQLAATAVSLGEWPPYRGVHSQRSTTNRLFLLKTGYDPEFAKCSPFKLLTYFAVQHAFETGLREVDFLGDTEPWKLEWTSTTRPHDWLFVFSGTPRSRLLHPLKFQFVPAFRRFQDMYIPTFQGLTATDFVFAAAQACRHNAHPRRAPVSV